MTPEGFGTRPTFPLLTGSYSDRIQEARALTDAGHLEEASAILERIISRLLRLPEQRRRLGSPRYLFLLASLADLMDIRTAQGDYKSALQLCQQLVELDAEEPEFWRRHACVLRLKWGQVEEGLAALHELALSQPDVFDHWLTLGAQAISYEQFDLADEALERAEELAEQAADTDLQTLVQIERHRRFVRQKRWHEAAAAWEMAAELRKELKQTREVIVRMFLRAGLLDDAERYLDDEHIWEPVADYYRALIAHRRGATAQAQQLWHRITKVDSQDRPRERIVQAAAWCWLQQPERAQQLLEPELGKGEEILPRVGLVLALAWAMQGNLEEAQAYLRQVMSKSTPEKDDLISALEWWPFEALVQDEAIKAELRCYFDLEDET